MDMHAAPARSLLVLAGTVLVVLGCARRPLSEPVVAEAETLAVDEAPVAAVNQEPAPPAGFRFPEDRGGKLLAELLPPREKLPPLPAAAAQPRPRPASRLLEQPDPPVPSLPADTPRGLAMTAARSPRPQLLPEGVPLVGQLATSPLPGPVTLPAGTPVRAWSPDVNQPLPLPLLARRQPEPPEADDPAAEASRAAALAAPVPVRTAPAPFLRLSVPDPYEHRRPARPLAPVAEEQVPAEVAVRLPGM